MKIYDRKKQSYYEERQYGGKFLKFLYQNSWGRILLKIVIHPLFSKCAAFYYRSRWSRRKISDFIKNYKIEMDAYENKQYQSFNDFFIRKLKEDELEKKKQRIQRAESEKYDSKKSKTQTHQSVKRCENCENHPKEGFKEVLISPADSKLCVYPINHELLFFVKNGIYSLEDLLGDRELASRYEGGTAMVFRLSVSDYHRYAFVQSGEIILHRKIRGSLHTVSSFSKEYRVFVRNSREYVVIKDPNGKEMIQMEIGAVLVGKIHNHELLEALKGEEKGYFEFGGSTIILLFQKEDVEIDGDILQICKEQMEVKVDYLETIGYFK